MIYHGFSTGVISSIFYKFQALVPCSVQRYLAFTYYRLHSVKENTYKYVFSLESLRTLYNSRHKSRSELKVDEVNRTTMHFFQNTGRYQQREEPFGRKPKGSWK